MGQKRQKIRIPKEGYVGAFIRMLPVLLMVGVVPLLVMQYDYEHGLQGVAWAVLNDVVQEFFLAPKSVALTILMVVMALGAGLRLWKKRGKGVFAKVLIPLFVYGFFCVLSACCSVYKEYSFSGGYEQFETIWVLLSYVLVVYYIFLYAQSVLELQVVADALCFSATIIGILGTLQGVGIDYMKVPFIQRLITSEELWQDGAELAIRVGENNAYATLYNPNYLGVYGAFMVLFLGVLMLFEKNKWRRIWHGVTCVLVMVALLSSRSRAGFISLFVVAVIALVVAFRKVLKWWYITVPALNLAVVIVLLVNAYNDNVIFERLQNIFTADNVEVAEEVLEDGTVIRKTGLTEMYTMEYGVAMTYNEESVLVAMEVGDGGFVIYVLNQDYEQMELVTEDNIHFRFTHPALKDVVLSPAFYGEDGILALCIEAGGTWYFYYEEALGEYQYIVLRATLKTEPCITIYGESSSMITAEHIGFENHQKLFSGRGFIWSRTLPLLRNHIVIGSGPDTFMFEFPHEDYLSMKQSGFERTIMTKPHSMYLQIGVQTGVLSLLCLLVFYGWYAVWSCRLYAFRKLSTQTEAFGIAAFIGSIGYMISGITNDSMVVTAPVFWGMIGLGMAANYMVSKSRKENPEMKENCE